MNRQHRVTGATLPRGAAMTALAGLLSIALISSPAHAVTITGSAYAAESGGPPPNPKSTTYNIANPTSASANIRSDVSFSHAQSWASAQVTPSGVTKTTGGRGWVDVPGGFDGRSNLWNAYASGTQLIVNGPPGSAGFHFVIPANGVPTQFNAQPVNLPTDPSSITPPPDSQGLVVNRGQIGGAMPSFFDVFVQLDVTAQQGGNPKVDLFHGNFQLDPNTATFTGTGGFAGVSPVFTPSPNSPQFTVTFPTDISGGSFDAVVGQPFNLQFDEYMTMGDPNHQFPGSPPPAPFDFSNRTVGPIGAGGAFAAQFLLDDPRTFTVAPTPEPSSLVLLVIGAFGACFAVRKRRRVR
jgi:hypothetical protein